MHTHYCAVALSIVFGWATAQAASQLPSDVGTDPSALIELKDDSSRAEHFVRIVEEAKEAMIRQRNRVLHGEGATAPPMMDYKLIGPFAFPRDADYDTTEAKPRTNSIFGIDVSHYTMPNIPLQALRQSKITFLYAKATQGVSHYDGKFSFFWNALDELPLGEKVHRGAYHFLTADDDATAQAYTFLNFLAAKGGLRSTDMPPVLDLEWDKTESHPDRWKDHDPGKIIEKALTWLRIVKEKTGRTPLLYTAQAWWRERGIPEKELFDQLSLSQYKIWIADYSPSSRAVEVPTVPTDAPWILWQFSEKATLPLPYDQGVDATIFKGPESQFYLDFGLAKFQ